MPKAEIDLKIYAKAGHRQKLQKIESLFEELKTHPETGAGKPERLKHGLSGYWSRRIDKENRMVYCIEEDEITVFIVSAKGHY